MTPEYPVIVLDSESVKESKGYKTVEEAVDKVSKLLEENNDSDSVYIYELRKIITSTTKMTTEVKVRDGKTGVL
jgi:hypothetical protein